MDKLRVGQRYLFHMNRPFIHGEKSFRANVFAKYRETLVVNCCETERNVQTQVSIPLNWFKKAETLEDIVCKNPILPSEILLMIDGYLWQNWNKNIIVYNSTTSSSWNTYKPQKTFSKAPLASMLYGYYYTISHRIFMWDIVFLQRLPDSSCRYLLHPLRIARPFAGPFIMEAILLSPCGYL